MDVKTEHRGAPLNPSHGMERLLDERRSIAVGGRAGREVKNQRAGAGEGGPMRTKPVLRGVSHELAFSAAVSAGVLLVATARSGEAKLGCGLYAASLAGLFGISALYHRPTWPERVRSWLRRIDHAAIFVLIGGTYTPLALTLPRPVAYQMLGVAWTGAALGVVRALFFPRAR